MTTPMELGVIALSLLTTICRANELKDYCSMHKFDNLPGGLRFTKEVVTTEYANIGAFKALHCCLRGYRSIEWRRGKRRVGKEKKRRGKREVKRPPGQPGAYSPWHADFAQLLRKTGEIGQRTEEKETTPERRKRRRKSNLSFSKEKAVEPSSSPSDHERYKDNRAYPWPGGESHFILYPESANQTIYAQKVRASDAGRYSCRARNDTTILEGDITLAVLGEKSGGYTGKPLPTYRPASQLVPLGGAARLFCEAYLGKVELPDAKNSVTWSKSDSNVTLPNHGRIAQHRVSRENNQIIGSYLEIEDITLEDYGEYKCEVSNGVDEEITLPAHVYRQEPQFALGLQNGSWRKSFLVGVLVLVLLISAGAFYARCWLPLVLLCRDKFAPLEENASLRTLLLSFGVFVISIGRASSLGGDLKKNFRIAIIDSPVHSIKLFHDVSIETFLERLISRIIRKSTIWFSGGLEIGPHATSCRRIIVILSPSSLGNIWNESSVGAVLKQLSSLSTRTIVIATKDLPNTTTIAKRSSRGCNDAGELSLDRFKILQWEENGSSASGSKKFWYKLRLAMPPVRPINSQTGCQSVAMIVQANGKCGQQKARSRESLEVLV
ncbi:hypothetical protein WH47_04176 [Habropoda laboriosa]|uniref:Soluble interferon alpha/beta receptor OPG204 n=1 Tax=Habropoda laboriosa TaxID=597456 RepID=A0A0L7QVI8_9HYME|nr:hypothetical protein WH47_04176 [Habropoda laboriosa]